jgi:NADPH2:quinone reductase
MKALVFTEFGTPDVLHLAEVPDPILGPRDALVRIAYAGLNFADVYRRQGNYHLKGKSPGILGYEGSGHIEAVGADIEGLRIGDRVAFADSPFSNAEFAVVDTDKIIPVPSDITLETAAAVLLQGLTAQYLVSDSYDIRPGDVALVHAAGGGVGLLLCQLARDKGAKVVAIASSETKRQAALRVGANLAFGYENWRETVIAATGEVDVAYDSVGSTLTESLAVVRTGGSVVFYGMAGGDPQPVDPRVLMDRSLKFIGGDLWNVLKTREDRIERSSKLFSLIGSGKLSVEIAAVFPLSEGASGHRLLEERSVIGKILLCVAAS